MRRMGRPTCCAFHRGLGLAGALALLGSGAFAQSPTPATEPAAPAAPAAPTARVEERVEVTGRQETALDERRQSVAGKVVITREEIDRFGDTRLSDVLRRAPGVTLAGPGGAPRLLGLGDGYTQLLIDGQPAPAGFVLDTLSPDQVERIEILRSPTAETGARAIAGTINIITRRAGRPPSQELRLALGGQAGHAGPRLSWTRHHRADQLSAQVSATASSSETPSRSSQRNRVVAGDTGVLLEDWQQRSSGQQRSQGLNLGADLQWQLGDEEDSFGLSPLLMHSRWDGTGQFEQHGVPPWPLPPGMADNGQTTNAGRYSLGQLGWSWQHGLGRWQLLTQGHARVSEGRTSDSRYSLAEGLPPRLQHNSQHQREQAGRLSLRASTRAGPQTGSGRLVSGLELESSRQDQQAELFEDGVQVPTGPGTELRLSIQRLAAFVQHEKPWSPQLTLQPGLRWEAITTRAVDPLGAPLHHRSALWTPSLHAVYKPKPQGSDQFRLSLTRSYRPPMLGMLMLTPTLHPNYPASGPNTEVSPDTAGQPGLRPEVATGLDLGMERQLPGGGLLSVKWFHRRIQQQVLSQTQLETVPWSPVPRWVARPVNLGVATSQGLELEAQGRLDHWLDGAPPLSLRAQLALYRSRVHHLPGPDNRLYGQARGSLQLGADYRFSRWPVTLGASLQHTAGYRSRVAVNQLYQHAPQQAWDAYALWTVRPDLALRLSGSQLGARDFTRHTTLDSGPPMAPLRYQVEQQYRNPAQWQLRLELKL